MMLIVPYRNREDHLKTFINRLSHHDIVVVEQDDNKPFNRAKLINIGFLEMRPDVFVANDVDMIGTYPAYVPLKGVNQLCKSAIQLHGYLGGATMYEAKYFPGYHNDYFHRAEDNEMRFHLNRLGTHISEWDFEFEQLPHERSGAEFIPWLWAKAQLPRSVNMLETCKYLVTLKEQRDGYTLIKAFL